MSGHTSQAIRVPDRLTAAAAAAFDRRRHPIQGLVDDAMTVARTCRDMAARFRAGGRLLVFGSGACATDAEHVAVEFVHPVIVGKRSFPALSLASDSASLTGIARQHGRDEVFARQVRTLGRPTDIAMGLSVDSADVAVSSGLQAAKEMGMLTVALGGGGGSVRTHGADHCLIAGSLDPLIIKEANVTTYHVLWELVHVFAETATGESSTGAGVESLYPFLYGGSHDETEIIESVAASAVAKVDEIVRLRAQAGDQLAAQLAECASRMAGAFAAGGSLWAFGNGGSSTDAQEVVHMFLDPPSPYVALPAVSLTSDAAVLTALSNDVGFDVVFTRQIRAFARPGDIAVGLSTSGGSTNVLDALDVAAEIGLVTVGVAGYGGGRMAELASLDHLFAVSSASVHRVQEIQTTIYHVLWELTQLAMGSGPK